MRTITTTTNLYTYDELSPEAKEQARNDYAEFEHFYSLKEDLGYRLSKLLEEHKIHTDQTPKISYSLSYCQGDGAMFEIIGRWKNYNITVTQSGHYTHYNSKTIDITTMHDNEAKESVYTQFNDLYVTICKNLERSGYEIIEYHQSEEYIKQLSDDNDYEYTRDGKLF